MRCCSNRYVDDPRKATPAQISQAALDTVPAVAPLYWSFRIMVGLGMFFIVLMATFFVLSARHTLADAHRWLLEGGGLYSIPLPWIAAEAGWIVAEVGRQPWVIEGVLPTAVAVSSLGVITALLITIAGFVTRSTRRCSSIEPEAHAASAIRQRPGRASDITDTVAAGRGQAGCSPNRSMHGYLPPSERQGASS